jgi:hypothetical protein
LLSRRLRRRDPSPHTELGREGFNVCLVSYILR